MALGGWPGLGLNSKEFELPRPETFSLLGRNALIQNQPHMSSAPNYFPQVDRFMGANTECHWPLTFEVSFFQQHWALLLEDIWTHVLSAYRHTEAHIYAIWCYWATEQSIHIHRSVNLSSTIYAMLRRALRDDSTYSPSSLHIHSSPCAAITRVIITECPHKTHYLLWTVISAKSRKYYRTRKRKMRAGRVTKIRWVCKTEIKIRFPVRKEWRETVKAWQHRCTSLALTPFFIFQAW